MLCLIQTSETEEGPGAHKSLTHLGKLTQVWVYVGNIQNNKTMKFRCEISYCEKQIIYQIRKVLLVNLFTI